MDDLISRQAAIDVLKGLEFCHYMEFGEYIGEDTIEVRLIRAEKAHDALQKLPTAQPEIIRCKDCKHFEYDHAYIIQGVPVLGHEVCNAWGDGCKTDENGYCFMAERRTDDVDVNT